MSFLWCQIIVAPFAPDLLAPFHRIGGTLSSGLVALYGPDYSQLQKFQDRQNEYPLYKFFCNPIHMQRLDSYLYYK